MDEMLKDIGVPVQAVYGALPDLIPNGPAIAFRRVGASPVYTKRGSTGTVTVEVWVYHPQYAEGVELAERVRASIEAKQGEVSGLILNSSTLLDAVEDYTGDKFVQILTFSLEINTLC